MGDEMKNIKELIFKAVDMARVNIAGQRVAFLYPAEHIIQALLPDMPEEKPDGFVAWHPEKGAEPLTFVSENAGEDAAFYLLIDEDCAGYDFSDASNPDCNETDQMERAKREGWQIRPVKLTFLDKQ